MPILGKTPESPAEKKYRAAYYKRFPQPKGTEGFLGRMVGTIIDWRESGSKLKWGEYVESEVTKSMGPSPSPTSLRKSESETAKRKTRLAGRGRLSTILAKRSTDEQGRMLI